MLRTPSWVNDFRTSGAAGKLPAEPFHFCLTPYPDKGVADSAPC